MITNLFCLCKEKTCINLLLFECLNIEKYFLAVTVFIFFTLTCSKEFSSTWKLSLKIHLDCLKAFYTWDDITLLITTNSL